MTSSTPHCGSPAWRSWRSRARRRRPAISSSSSKVAQGQRYQSDDQRYDPYFDNVHQAQVAAAAWPDEKKATRRPLVNALALTPDCVGRHHPRRHAAAREVEAAAASSISRARTSRRRAAANDSALFAALEETVRLELDRARKMKDKSDKLDEMSKHGEELKKAAETEASQRGAEKADEKKTEKSREIRRELGGAIDATRTLSQQALRQSKYAQEFLDDLGDAVEASSGPRRPQRSERVEAAPAGAAAEGRAAEGGREEARRAEGQREAEAVAGFGKPKPAAPARRKASACGEAGACREAGAGAKPAPPPDEVFNP